MGTSLWMNSDKTNCWCILHSSVILNISVEALNMCGTVLLRVWDWSQSTKHWHNHQPNDQIVQREKDFGNFCWTCELRKWEFKGGCSWILILLDNSWKFDEISVPSGKWFDKLKYKALIQNNKGLMYEFGHSKVCAVRNQCFMFVHHPMLNLVPQWSQETGKEGSNH